MPPPLPSAHRGMTANPLKPSRYRPGKPVAEEPSSEEEEEEEEKDEAATKAREEEERRRRAEAQRRQRQAAPKASSFPAGKITKGVQDVKIDEKEEEEEDEEGFVTDEDEVDDQTAAPKGAPRVAGDKAGLPVQAPVPTAGEGKGEDEEEEEEEQEEESSEEESSSEDEAPKRVLLRPTFIKKDKRNAQDPSTTAGASAPDTTAEAAKQEALRKEKADTLIRDQLEKAALERNEAKKQWDDDEAEVGEEGAIDDTDGLDAEGEYAAWKLRELKRVKREREQIEASEKEREEVERRRNLTAEEREREDREFISKQQEEKEATRGQSGFMQRYFHKGAFFRDDLEREGLDKRNVMAHRFVDDVSRETLPQYMQVRDMTQLGKKGRTRYRDLKSEDTGRFGEGFDNRRRRPDGPPVGITDERFMPDRPDNDRSKGPTGANASAVRERRRSQSRSYSPRRRDRNEGHERERSRDRGGDRYRPEGGSRRKRSPSPYDDREKRRRMESAS